MRARSTLGGFGGGGGHAPLEKFGNFKLLRLHLVHS